MCVLIVIVKWPTISILRQFRRWCISPLRSRRVQVLVHKAPKALLEFWDPRVLLDNRDLRVKMALKDPREIKEHKDLRVHLMVIKDPRDLKG